MFTEDTRYIVELACGYPEWWRFNLYMIVISCDRDGNSLSFRNYTDRVYDVEYGTSRSGPDNFDPAARTAVVESDPCHHIEVYVYAVTNTFPDSDAIKDSPPFTATLNILADGHAVESADYEVNQWGGLTIVGKRFPSDK